MAFADAFHPKFKSDLKKIDKSASKDIKEKHLDIILNNPMGNEPLKGKLAHIRSYHFQKNSTHYRIAYEVLEDKEIVFHYMLRQEKTFIKN